MNVTIFAATAPEDFHTYAGLIRDYVDWLRQRLAQDKWFMEKVMSHQALDKELEDVAGKYGPPKGRTFLVRSGSEIVAGIAYNKMADGICEMKRLYVKPAFHGQGLGRKLCNTLIQAAVLEGYRLMRLDTARHLTEAIGMYKSLAFRRCPPYRDYPAELLPYLVFMDKPLAPA